MDNTNHSKKQSIKVLVAAIALSASLSASWVPSKFCDLDVGIQDMTNDGKNLYVRPNTETAKASIIMVEPNGATTTLGKTTFSGGSGGIAYVNGKLWVSESQNKIEQIKPSDGSTISSVSISNVIFGGLTGDGTSKYPYVAGQNGNIYEVDGDNSALKWLDTSDTSDTADGIFGITCMKGELYLTYSKTNKILKAKLNRNTSATSISYTVIEMPDDSLVNPMGITNDGRNLFVVNAGKNFVSKITVNATGPATVSTIADFGKVSALLTSPAAITFMDGALYVAGFSKADGRIVKLMENRENFVTREEVASDIATALLDAANTAQDKVTAAIKPFVTYEQEKEDIKRATEKFVKHEELTKNIADITAMIKTGDAVDGKSTTAIDTAVSKAVNAVDTKITAALDKAEEKAKAVTALAIIEAKLVSQPAFTATIGMLDRKITAIEGKITDITAATDTFASKDQVASDIAAALENAGNAAQGKIDNELIATLNKDRAAQAQTIAALTQSNHRMKCQFSREIEILKELVEQNISILQAALEREARERRAGDAASRRWWWWA